MYRHSPDNYICPFCLFVQGIENEHVLSVRSDLIYQNDIVTAFVASHQFLNSAGNALVIPNAHYENIFELPIELATDLHRVVRAVAFALKAGLSCDGVSTRQHNEPAGNQDVWHYHVHVTPRYPNDALYSSRLELMTIRERAEYAGQIRAHLREL